ncbi:hypothetical protein CDO51_09695 [Natranaerobius trueperi]|uniref:DUF1659 domain-containing protein n=2 Tax=Natranaerobius trueperi TaxID=759412 RepID=A0A226BWT4_9FIRM|nr:hypothetical protein CDO51_09695 [Natranaerobius trueperi]
MSYMVVETFGPSRLQFRLIVGEDEEGKNILRTNSFSRIKPDAEDSDVYEVGELLLGLQKYEALSVHRFDSKELARVDN